MAGNTVKLPFVSEHRSMQMSTYFRNRMLRRQGLSQVPVGGEGEGKGGQGQGEGEGGAGKK